MAGKAIGTSRLRDSMFVSQEAAAFNALAVNNLSHSTNWNISININPSCLSPQSTS